MKGKKKSWFGDQAIPTKDVIDKLSTYVCSLYGTPETKSVDEAWYLLFRRGKLSSIHLETVFGSFDHTVTTRRKGLDIAILIID